MFIVTLTVKCVYCRPLSSLHVLIQIGLLNNSIIDAKNDLIIGDKLKQGREARFSFFVREER